MAWIRRETEKGTVQYICPHCHDYHEFREDFGERTFNENYIFCRRCGAKNGTGTAPTLIPPNETLTLDELEKVKAERDAAVADMCAIIGEVEEIRRGYGVDNADADDAFAGLCESYCANYGHGCYKEGSNGYYCTNFKWRGPQKEE